MPSPEIPDFSDIPSARPEAAARRRLRDLNQAILRASLTDVIGAVIARRMAHGEDPIGDIASATGKSRAEICFLLQNKQDWSCDMLADIEGCLDLRLKFSVEDPHYSETHSAPSAAAADH